VVSQANPVRIFVTHAWENSDDYLRVFEYLESARNFFYRNYSAPEQRPQGDKEALRENLRKQIAPVEAVVALASLYDTQQDLMTFELLYAQASHKPVILLRHFGARREPPKPIVELADEIIEWDERALVDALKRQARHEETNRWDTIEFKLD
jgi:nucleoside 2-deoxyribosyltransferase